TSQPFVTLHRMRCLPGERLRRSVKQEIECGHRSMSAIEQRVILERGNRDEMGRQVVETFPCRCVTKLQLKDGADLVGFPDGRSCRGCGIEVSTEANCGGRPVFGGLGRDRHE